MNRKITSPRQTAKSFDRRRFGTMALGGLFAMLILPLSATPSREAVSVANALNGQHPGLYYQKAMQIFRSGSREDAMFVFYVGQLKYRAHLSARPELPPSGDPAAFGALTETVGRPLNEWGFGDLPLMDTVLADVLTYERQNPDRFTPPRDFADAWAKQRSGLTRFRQQMRDSAAEMRAQRKANGSENRR
jgi:hypothetical protein